MSNKIDSLVAEKVMEWVRHPRNTAHWVEGGRDPFMAPVMGLVPECGTGAWSPSTSISAAWAVVEKMRERRFTYTLSDTDSPTTRRHYCSFIDANGTLPPAGSVQHTNECAAICIAALRAVGVPESAIQEALQ